MTRKEIDEDIKRRKEEVLKNGKSKEYRCSICKDKRGFLYDLDGYDTWIDCECMQKQIATDRLERCGIGPEDRKKTLKDFETFGEKNLEDVKSITSDYINNFNKIKSSRDNSLLLSGASGRGKTMLGIIASMNIIWHGNVRLHYMPYRNDITSIKQSMTDEVEYRRKISPLIESDVLFIDDFFKGKITESDINIMYEVINGRYLERKPTIISTECTLNELKKIDEAVESRIIEMSKSHIAVFSPSVMNYRERGMNQ